DTTSRHTTYYISTYYILHLDISTYYISTSYILHPITYVHTTYTQRTQLQQTQLNSSKSSAHLVLQFTTHIISIYCKDSLALSLSVFPSLSISLAIRHIISIVPDTLFL